MDKKILGLYLQIAGCLLGAVTAVLMLKWHPVLVSLLALGAAMYFAGEYLKK